ncbi:MAG: isochorismate synthase [Bacteroidota bacterium]
MQGLHYPGCGAGENFMNRGFAIWRPPGGSPQGLAGRFEESTITDIDLQHGFIFKPWSAEKPCYFIYGERVFQEALLREWTEYPDFKKEITQHGMMDLEVWRGYIQSIQHEIAQGVVQKVVASRTQMADTRVGLFDAFLAACARYPDAFVSIVYHEQYGVWLGATPEILVQPLGDEWKTVSMAGTLLDDVTGWTGKEIEENTVTQQHMEDVLRRVGAQIIKSGKADAVRAGALRHLVRSYHFSLSAHEIQSLISQLHPTPAVAGYHREKALSIIDTHESDGRGLFAGYLGYYENTKPHLWVNLRCCQWYGSKAILHAGAGINAMSNADGEWAETEAKMVTIGCCL